MKLLRVLVSVVGITGAYTLMGLGGWWLVPGLALFLWSVDQLPEWTT